MSFHFHLYRAPAGSGNMLDWTGMRAQPLGTAQEVRDQLAALYPQVVWKQSGPGAWSGLGAHDEPYLDVLLSEEEPGRCHFIVLNKAAPSVMRRIVETLGLTDVFAPEAGDMVDIYGYEDHDRYYARRGS